MITVHSRSWHLFPHCLYLDRHFHNWTINGNHKKIHENRKNRAISCWDREGPENRPLSTKNIPMLCMWIYFFPMYSGIMSPIPSGLGSWCMLSRGKNLSWLMRCRKPHSFRVRSQSDDPLQLCKQFRVSCRLIISAMRFDRMDHYFYGRQEPWKSLLARHLRSFWMSIPAKRYTLLTGCWGWWISK